MEIQRIKYCSEFDVIKIVFSFLIVAYHCELFLDVNSTLYIIIYDISIIGVPFFFCISGWLLQKQIIEQKMHYTTIINKQVVRLAKLWIVWEIVYTPFVLYSSKDKNIINALKQYYLVGSYAHLWYLKASVVALLIIFGLEWIKKKNKGGGTGQYICRSVFNNWDIYDELLCSRNKCIC